LPLRSLIFTAVLIPLAAPTACAGLFGRFAPNTHASAIALRKRVHVNTLITEPGTMEIEWGGAFSTTGNFTFPSTIKYTPEGPYVWWGRTEFSASFDSLASAVQLDNRVTQFSDRMTLAANCVVHDGTKLDLAIAPQTSFLLRSANGLRLGATGVARYDTGRHSMGVTVTWTAATKVSDSNPAGTLDLGAGYGRRLMAGGPLGHLTPHVNVLYERSTGVERQISIFEGVEYQITEKVAVDFAGQHFSVWGGQTDHQITVGLTVNTGRLRKKRESAPPAGPERPLVAR
jgi:hypothetical protein